MALLLPSISAQDFQQTSIPTITPQEDDFSAMWWQDGFPSRVINAPWVRCIQTGEYALALNTETLKISHLSSLSSNFAVGNDEVWKQLKPAQLELNITLDGKIYRCKKGVTWTRDSGPRLIESGRFVQRADIIDLTFVSEEGRILDFETRFETVAWPHRLGFILHARPTHTIAEGLPGDWNQQTLQLSLKQGNKRLQESLTLTPAPKDSPNDWHHVALTFNPTTWEKVTTSCPLKVEAKTLNGEQIAVTYDSSLSRHRIDINQASADSQERSNDTLERIPLTLTNPTLEPQVARLCFEKTGNGFHKFMGSSITGISAILCDSDGNPSGIPIQLSKNWHNSPQRPVYSGAWFHGSTLVNLPPKSVTELQLVIVCGHWGGVAAASHAQLCLIGWGSNQLWEQSALGSWGESVCYEPDQAQAATTITDVRPLMVTADRNKLWKWTANVGGGDFFRLFDKDENRVPPSSMTATHHRLGPCLTEVTYQGKLGKGIDHATTVSLARTDDLVRATYRLRMKVTEATRFSRLALFQVGADTYNSTREKEFAVGTGDTLTKEWQTNWGDNRYRTPPHELVGNNPWVSLHQGEKIGQEKMGPSANRGFIIREWKARLGGKVAQPWVRERGIGKSKRQSSIMDLVPPPQVTSLIPGDYLEATIEHLVIPQSPKDYYGPNKDLRKALKKSGNTWQMVAREAKNNTRITKIEKGHLLRKFPDVRITADGEEAVFSLSNGLGYIPITFTNLSSHKGYQLLVNGKPLNQSVNGKDFWQSDYDAETKTWSRTYNLPCSPTETKQIHFARITKK